MRVTWAGAAGRLHLLSYNQPIREARESVSCGHRSRQSSTGKVAICTVAVRSFQPLGFVWALVASWLSDWWLNWFLVVWLVAHWFLVVWLVAHWYLIVWLVVVNWTRNSQQLSLRVWVLEFSYVCWEIWHHLASKNAFVSFALGVLNLMRFRAVSGQGAFDLLSWWSQASAVIDSRSQSAAWYLCSPPQVSQPIMFSMTRPCVFSVFQAAQPAPTATATARVCMRVCVPIRPPSLPKMPTSPVRPWRFWSPACSYAVNSSVSFVALLLLFFWCQHRLGGPGDSGHLPAATQWTHRSVVLHCFLWCQHRLGGPGDWSPACS